MTTIQDFYPLILVAGGVLGLLLFTLLTTTKRHFHRWREVRSGIPGVRILRCDICGLERMSGRR